MTDDRPHEDRVKIARADVIGLLAGAIMTLRGAYRLGTPTLTALDNVTNNVLTALRLLVADDEDTWVEAVQYLALHAPRRYRMIVEPR